MLSLRAKILMPLLAISCVLCSCAEGDGTKGNKDAVRPFVDALRSAVLGYLAGHKVTYSAVVEGEMKAPIDGEPIVRLEDGDEYIYFNGWSLDKRTKKLSKVIDRGRELYDIKIVFDSLEPQPSVANVAIIHDVKR